VDRIEEILKQYPCFGDDIKDAQSNLNMYITLQQEARDPLKAQKISHEPHGTETSDQTYNAVEKLIDRYQVEIDESIAKINSILDTKKWLDKALGELTETERRVIYMRYDKGISINKMPYYLHCGRNTIYKILDDAKAKIRRIM
jgi:DNA-directed RNA polymerase specialized sigma24 family protein